MAGKQNTVHIEGFALIPIGDFKHPCHARDLGFLTRLQLDANAMIFAHRQQVIDNILCIEVGHSFFPKDGVYAQLVSTGALELIEGAALKSLILEVYTHHKARNYATSNEIDMFNIDFRRAVLANFRIRFAYDADDGVFYGTRKVVSSELNRDYYRSSEFFGLLGQASLYANMYLRQLSDIKATYIDITQQLEP